MDAGITLRAEAIRWEDLNMTGKRTDVVVIGAGVVGVACAYYAAAAGARVRVLDQRRIAGGASYGNAGLLVPSHCEPLSSPGIVARGLRELLNPDGAFTLRPRPDLGFARWLLAFRRHCNEGHYRRALEIHTRLNRISNTCHEELAARGGDHYGYQRRGLLCPFFSAKALAEAERYTQRMRPLGIEFQVLGPNQVRRLEPSIQGPLAGATFGVADGRIDPCAFVHWLAHQAEELGVAIAAETEVFGFDRGRRRVTTVVTSRGRLAADQVVIAAGAWTPLLTRLLHRRLPIEAAKGYSITYQHSGQAPQIPVLLEEAAVAVTPLGDSVRLAGTLELAGLDLGIRRRRADAVERNGKERIRGSHDWQPEEIWSGLRPCTPDGLPVLGRLGGYDNVFVAGGHATKGMSQGPGTGKLLAELLGGAAIGALADQLSPRRFRSW